jgi:hypothetical protein
VGDSRFIDYEEYQELRFEYCKIDIQSGKYLLL